MLTSKAVLSSLARWGCSESSRSVRKGSVPSFYIAPDMVLEELGIRDPEDIKIEAIAEHCGATILYERLEGAEARILGYGERAIITVNGAAPRARQRFSGAHELGHWMCDRGKIAFACTDRSFTREWLDDNPERRANQYAAELLLPQKMFSPRAKIERSPSQPLVSSQTSSRRV